MSTAIVIGPDVIPVRPDADHEYVIDTAAVAKGYGVTSEMVRQHKARHAEELTEGKHWVSVTNSNAQPGKGAQSQTLWTKRGVVRLGFFIRSKRAKIFRDLAEDLVIKATTPAQSSMSYPEALRRLADAVERGDKTADALTIIAPRAGFGSLSERTGEPRTRLIPAHYRSGLNTDEATRRFVQFQGEFIDMLLSR